jgi:ABC-2 type transport system permease protein
MTLSFPALSIAARRRRVFGVVYRDFAGLRRNPPRLLETIFWPTSEVIQWGLVSLFLAKYQVPTALAMLLGAVLFWQVIPRSQTDMSVAFLEDVWSRNIVNVFVTPLTTGEYLAGLLIVGLLKVAANTVLMATLAFVLYGFGLLTIGPGLVPFMMVLLVMGWALGTFAIATVIRFGASVQTLAWMLSFFFLPFSAVFYPLAVLPGPVQAIAHAVPASYVFEGMRAVIAGHGVSWSNLGIAVVLDAVYVAAALLYLGWAIRHSRRSGRLSRFSE